MPFKSLKQMSYMYAKHPEIAKRWTEEAKQQKKSFVQPSKRKVKKG